MFYFWFSFGNVIIPTDELIIFFRGFFPQQPISCGQKLTFFVLKRVEAFHLKSIHDPTISQCAALNSFAGCSFHSSNYMGKFDHDQTLFSRARIIGLFQGHLPEYMAEVFRLVNYSNLPTTMDKVRSFSQILWSGPSHTSDKSVNCNPIQGIIQKHIVTAWKELQK